jgi:hypothetical protein
MIARTGAMSIVDIFSRCRAVLQPCKGTLKKKKKRHLHTVLGDRCSKSWKGWGCVSQCVTVVTKNGPLPAQIVRINGKTTTFINSAWTAGTVRPAFFSQIGFSPLRHNFPPPLSSFFLPLSAPISSPRLLALSAMSASSTRIEELTPLSYEVASRQATINVSVVGSASHGKCWGKGTRLLMFDGSIKLVEDIALGDRLMGGDGTSRTVTALGGGATTLAGNTGVEAQDVMDMDPDHNLVTIKPNHLGPEKRPSGRAHHADGLYRCKYEACERTFVGKDTRLSHEASSKLHRSIEAVPAMYRITSANEGRDAFTCNNAHILVLKWRTGPSSVQEYGERKEERTNKFFYQTFGIKDGLVMQRSLAFPTRELAQAAYEEARRIWRPLEWECTVDQFLQCSPSTQKAALMFQPAAVQFAPPVWSLRNRLLEIAKNVRSMRVTEEFVALTAWVLGMWLADGHASCAYITQIGEDINDPTHGHEQVIEKLKAWHHAVGQVSHLDIVRARSQLTSAGNTAYTIVMGPVFHQLLRDYALIENKHFHSDLLRESKEVRLQLLAGMLDGDGYLLSVDGTSNYEVSAKERPFVEGLIHLARSLGFGTGKVNKTACINKITGEIYMGWRIHISGWGLDQVPVALDYKKAPARINLKVDPSCAGFKIKKIPHDDYYGFTLDGDGRCLLADFTITHNTSVVKALSGVHTLRHKAEISSGKTLRIGHANTSIFKCDKLWQCCRLNTPIVSAPWVRFSDDTPTSHLFC